MLTTLYCDASFCPETLAGGWAVWLKSNQGRIVRSGLMPSYVQNSNDAELAAIFAGVYLATQKWPSTEAILVRSDSQTALRWMRSAEGDRRDETQRLAAKIQELRAKHNFRIIDRWVKGHRRGTQTDVWLNNRVDEMAREVMLKERSKRRRKK